MAVKFRNPYVGPAIAFVGLAFLLLIVLSGGKGGGEKGTDSIKNALFQYIGEKAETEVWDAFVPVFSYVQSNGSNALKRLAGQQIKKMVPLLFFDGSVDSAQTEAAEQMTLDMILLAESGEGSVDALFEAENQAAVEGAQNQVQTGLNAEELTDVFVPHTAKLVALDTEALSDYETMLKTFYTVDKSTNGSRELLDINKMEAADLTISKVSEGPQILIYHTHSQEAFSDSVPGDPSTSIVGVGANLAKILTETYGYQVLHHNGSYDLPSRDDAYSVALPEIEKILEENPTIQVVIDLHRDAVEEETRLVMDLDGRPTARFMFFNGLSRTRKTGNISYLYNENLEGNLAFSFQLQKKALEYYPGLTRKVYLKAYRYNMHLRARNLLVELGAQNNTVEEAMNACDPLAHILDMVLSGEE